MKQKFFLTLLSSALLAATAVAQGPQGRGGAGTASRISTGLDMTRQTDVAGTISSVQLAYGAQYPSIVVGKIQIKVAPVWFLLDNDFELAVGDTVTVHAALANNTNDSYLYAIQITKTASGAGILLRSELGVPLWSSAADGRGANATAPRTGTGAGTGAGAGCIDPASIKTVTGVIDKVSSGVGIQLPTLVLKLADSTLLTVKIGPERLILANDFELNPGDKLTVKYAACTCTDEFVALQLIDSAGTTLTLREDDGTPVRK
jgi:hypothetical protein